MYLLLYVYRVLITRIYITMQCVFSFCRSARLWRLCSNGPVVLRRDDDEESMWIEDVREMTKIMRSRVKMMKTKWRLEY